MKTLDEIKKLMKEDFEIRSKSNRIIVYTKSEQDYNVFTEKIKESGVDYHTYTILSKKPVKSVLKGIPLMLRWMK